jgi:hypothetical protein
MKNANHLLIFANMLLRLFIRLTHLVTALNTLNNIDIILTPHCQNPAPGTPDILPRQ